MSVSTNVYEMFRVAVFSPGPFRVAAAFACYPLLSVDPGSILERAFFFFFFLSSFFPPPLLFLPLSLSARWFNTHQIQILFLSLFFFFSLFGSFFPFFSSSNFPLAFLLFSFSYSFPIPFLLLVCFFSSPFCCFSFSLYFSHRLALMPAPPPTTPSKNPGENTGVVYSNVNLKIVPHRQGCMQKCCKGKANLSILKTASVEDNV